MKHKHDFITYRYAAFFVILALVLAGCKTQPSGELVITPEPVESPTPQPTPRLDADADDVKRRDMIDVGFHYRIFVNGTPLTLKNGYEVDALEIPNARGVVRVFVPLRAVGETLGYRVDWQPRKRRVTWNNVAVQTTITLIDGWSYLPAQRFENHLRRTDNLATVKPARFDFVTGYVHIETREIKRNIR